MVGIWARNTTGLKISNSFFGGNGTDISVDRSVEMEVSNSSLTSERAIEIREGRPDDRYKPESVSDSHGDNEQKNDLRSAANVEETSFHAVSGWSRSSEKNWPFRRSVRMGITFENNDVKAKTFVRSSDPDTNLTATGNRIEADIVFDITTQSEVRFAFDDLRARGLLPAGATEDEFRNVIVAVIKADANSVSAASKLDGTPAWARWIEIGANTVTLLPAVAEIARRLAML